MFEAIPYGVDITYVGKGTVEELPGTYNDEFMLTAVPADGYKFYMWEVVDRSTGLITAVGSTNKAFIGVKCYAERIKMRVTFVVIPYSITYTLNGGTNASGNPVTYTVDDTVVLAEPGRDGYTFDGWYDASGKKITTIQEGTTGDLTLEARWSPRPYTITYNLDGGSNHPDNPATYTVETETITLKEPTKGVMIFDGWYDAGGNKVTQIVKNSTGDITLTARWKKAPAPAITFPTASDITYGQTLADSVLTGGSTEYGTFMWKMPSFVPMAGNIGWDLEFIPSADTEKYYEPIADADKTAKVKVMVNAATPALTVSAEKKDATTASLTATVQKAGEGMAPRGTVKFEYSTNGTNWTDVPSGIATLSTDANGNAQATADWTFPAGDAEYQIRVSYDSSTDANYYDASATTSFDPRKQDQTGFAVAAPLAEVTYGDTLRIAVSNALGTGALTYTVSDDSILTVDADGKATILKSGTVIVTATKAGDATYNAATASVSVTVKKAKLTFTADDKTVNLGGAMPTLTFTTTGLVSGDTVSADPDLTTTATGTNTAGTFDIQITGGAVTTKNGAVWTDCYEPQYVNGKLTVNAAYNVTVTNGTALVSSGTAATTIQAFPDDTVTVTADAPQTGFKFGGWNVTSGTITLSDANNTTATFTMPKENVALEATYVIDASQITKTTVECTVLTDVPQSLRGIYSSLDDMKEAMLNKLVGLGLNGTNVGSNYLFYDVVLKVSFDNGLTWEVANEHNFPKEGLSVFLTDQRTGGYPNGTARNTHRFYVSHMFTTNVNGKTPGDTEEMIASNQQGGISVTLTGLSPVLVTWEKVTTPTQPTQPTTPGSGGGSGGGTPTVQPTSTGGQNAVENTNTTVVSTNALGARSASDAQNTSARGGQTGDDIYERLGLHTMILLAALLLLIANLRKVMEENALLAVGGSEMERKKQTSVPRNRKLKTRTKRTQSGLGFIVLDVETKKRPIAKRCNKNNRNVRKH